MQELQIFRHQDFGEMGLIEIDGKPYFPATACAKMLGYKRPADAIASHCKGSVKHRVLTTGGEQEIKIIPEGDLYRLITHSRLPKAEEFERWVFDEVLPTIRRQGSYMPDITEIIRQTVAETVAEVMKQMLPVMIRRYSLRSLRRSQSLRSQNNADGKGRSALYPDWIPTYGAKWRACSAKAGIHTPILHSILQVKACPYQRHRFADMHN